MSQTLHALITQSLMPAEKQPIPVPSPGRLPVQTIPAVSLSRVMGLLEVLENEGALELFELNRHANLELTQLLLVVKAAELLHWVATPEGRVEMSPAGGAFLRADIPKRKELLNARLRSIFVFDLIIQALKQSANHEVDETVIVSQLALLFPRERPQHLLKTIVSWARYAALFKYDSTRKVIYEAKPDATMG